MKKTIFIFAFLSLACGTALSAQTTQGLALPIQLQKTIDDATQATEISYVETKENGTKIFYSGNIYFNGGEKVLCLGQVQVIPGTICSGNWAMMIFSFVNGATPVWINWSTGQTNDTIFVNPTTPTTYSVTAMDPAGCSVNVTPDVNVSGIAPILAFTSTSVNCGQNNGTINMTVTGGIQPYTYFWNNGSQSQDPNGLSAGTYTVTVIDANGCTHSGTAVVSGTNAPSVTFANVVNVACFGQATGSATAIATGAGPFTYTWSNGQTTPTATSLAAGNYTVTVTGNGGCTTTATATISQPIASLSLSTQTTSPSCGQYLGSINLTVSGGTPGYTYQWNSSNGNFCFGSQDPTSLALGIYSVTVTDSHGCTATKTASVLAPICTPDTTVVICDTTVYDTNHVIVNVADTTVTHTSITITDTTHTSVIINDTTYTHVAVTVNDTTWVPVVLYDTTYTSVTLIPCDTVNISANYGDYEYGASLCLSGPQLILSAPSGLSYDWHPVNGSLVGGDYFPPQNPGHWSGWVNVTHSTTPLVVVKKYCYDYTVLEQPCFTGPSATEDRNNSGEIVLYPNPSTTEITFELPTISPTEVCNVYIFDARSIKVANIEAQNGSQINVEYLSPGIYYLVIRTKDQTFTSKFVKI